MALKTAPENLLRLLYQASFTPHEEGSCPICQEAKRLKTELCLAEDWAIINTEYEISHAPLALQAIEQGKSLFDWARTHWMFDYADDLPRQEYNDLIRDNIAGRRLVHIGCGALPLTGCYYAQVLDEVLLVDLDPAALEAAGWISVAEGYNNIDVRRANGKDIALRPDDIVLVANMVLDKRAVLENCRSQGVQNVLLRACDSRPRHIFYQALDGVAEQVGYHFVQHNTPPLRFDSVTYHYQLCF